MTIELAPRNKRGLHLSSPLIAGSGAVGYGDAWPPGLAPDLFGAMVTSPISLRSRAGSPQPRVAEIPGGFLYTTGDHNPGFKRVIANHASAWQKLGIPVLLSLVGVDAGDRVWMAARLEETDVGAAGIELPVPEDINLGEASAFIAAVRRATTLPLLVRLPSTRAAYLAETCVIAGADALTVGTPPPGAAPAEDGIVLEAPLAGPAAFPFTLRALRRVSALRLDAPLIAAGGVATLDDVAQCLDAGAVAVQVRSLLWTHPMGARRLAEAVTTLVAEPPTAEA